MLQKEAPALNKIYQKTFLKMKGYVGIYIKTKKKHRKKIEMLSCFGNKIKYYFHTNPMVLVLCQWIYISCDSSSITSIPVITLQEMWSKAEELPGIENAVTLAPGFKDKDRML